jgi:predicted Zn-dependent peptidase
MKKTILFLLPVMLSAQEPASAPAPAPPVRAAEPPKGRAPVSKEVLRVKFPRPVEVRLENGLTVLILEDHRMPTIAMSLDIRGAGGLYDPAQSTGLAGVTASMMREGTATRTNKEIVETLDRLAAGAGVFTGQTSLDASMNISGLTENFEKWFPLAVDILLHPTFPAEEWAKLKQRQLLGLRQQRTSPGFLSRERFNKAVYGDHPAAVTSATPATLETITPEAMKKWHDERYVPQNAILGVVGDVTPAEILPKLRAALGGWKKTEYQAQAPANPAPAAEKRVWIVNRPNAVQTSLVMGNIAIERKNPDYFALLVANQVLGGGSTARLFLNLRQDKGYTYSALSGFGPGIFAGPWEANSDVRTEVTEGAMREFFNEFRRLREEKAPAAELEEKKRAVVARFALSLESPATLLNYAITRKFFGLPEDYWDIYPAKIAAVTADDVQRVARKYLNLDAMQIVAVGDAGKIRTAMEAYGKVTVFDVDGKVVE